MSCFQRLRELKRSVRDTLGRIPLAEVIDRSIQEGVVDVFAATNHRRELGE